MKFHALIKMIFIALFGFIQPNFAQVGIGTTNPDGSSMLDIQSDSKGVLIPRMTTALRTVISSPANGLLVFDTDTKSFWYYNLDAWKELVGEATLADNDGDTKIEVEKTADLDEINFTTTGAERMKIDTNGVIFMGDSNSGDYTKVTTDGSLSYVGEATRWDDLKVAVNSVKIGGGKKDAVAFDPAEWDAFKESGLALLWFKNKAAIDEQDIVFTVQMPHGWKEGTNIFPHVHWSTGRIDKKSGALKDSPVPGTARVTWGLEYTWVSVGGVFPDTTIITGTNIAKFDSGHEIALYEHVITPLGTGGIDGSGRTLSSMLVCRLFRNSSADNYSGDAGLLEIDFHYQIDSDGSNEEYTKY